MESKESKQKNKPEIFKEYSGSFDKTKLIKIQNEINNQFNSDTQNSILNTYAVRVIYKNKKYKDSWVNFSKRNPENILGIIIWTVKQQTTIIN